VANVLEMVSVKEFLKSVNICEDIINNRSVCFFMKHSVNLLSVLLNMSGVTSETHLSSESVALLLTTKPKTRSCIGAQNPLQLSARRADASMSAQS